MSSNLTYLYITANYAPTMRHTSGGITYLMLAKKLKISKEQKKDLDKLLYAPNYIAMKQYKEDREWQKKANAVFLRTMDKEDYLEQLYQTLDEMIALVKKIMFN